MSEYMERHSISKLIGSPPGYVGYEEAGQLTEAVRHRPYSIVLFDEIEKAHPEVFNILLQVLDDGHLTDAKGRKVNFKNAVIILTSNIGSQYFDKMTSVGFSEGNENDEVLFEKVEGKVNDSLKESFSPEFLNRLDDVVMFKILGPEVIKEIVKIQIDKVIERLKQKEITMNVSHQVLEYLGKEGYNPQYGARPLKRLIQNKILTKVASLMVSRGIMEGGSVSVGMKNGEFTFEVKKSRVKKTKKKTSKKQEKVIA